MTRPSHREFNELRKVRITRGTMTNKGATPLVDPPSWILICKELQREPPSLRQPMSCARSVSSAGIPSTRKVRAGGVRRHQGAVHRQRRRKSAPLPARTEPRLAHG